MEPNSNQINITNAEERITLLEQKIDYLVKEARSSARARRITIIITLIFVVAPVIIIMLILPSMMSSITSSYNI